MDNTLFEELLNQEESSLLDFKRNQYLFSRASEEDKSELLKDILAFANVVKEDKAYILIGVEDIKGGKSKVVGINRPFDDSRLQQFVNSKTQRPVNFIYKNFLYEGKQIGIIEIWAQIIQPIFLTNDYGKLRKNIVYIRRGSSTEQVPPDEIIERYGKKIEERKESPKINLELANVRMKTSLGNSTELTSTIMEYDKSKILRKNFPLYSVASHLSNKKFEEEMAIYLAQTSFYKPLGFKLVNNSSLLAKNVKLEIFVHDNTFVKIIDENMYPIKPKRDFIMNIRPVNFHKTDVNVEKQSNGWIIKCKIGNIQPRAINWSENVFYVGSNEKTELKLEAKIYADNLPEPLNNQFSIKINTMKKQLDLTKLVDMD